jgi:hypothetical protein
MSRFCLNPVGRAGLPPGRAGNTGMISCFYYLGGPISRFSLNPCQTGQATTRPGGYDQLFLLPGGPNKPVLPGSLADGPGYHQARRVIQV